MPSLRRLAENSRSIEVWLEDSFFSCSIGAFCFRGLPLTFSIVLAGLGVFEIQDFSSRMLGFALSPDSGEMKLASTAELAPQMTKVQDVGSGSEVTGTALLLSICHELRRLLSRGCIKGSHPLPDFIEN